MRMTMSVALVLVFLSSMGRGEENPPAAIVRELHVLCGSSMRTPFEEIAKVFEEERRAKVVPDFGGSETLLPKILTGTQADIFICHDPFEQKVKDAGKYSSSVAVGYLRPVLLVKKGNPKGIKSVEDLAAKDVQIGIGDPRYSTCGEMFVKMLEGKGLKDRVMAHVKLQARTHQEIASGLIVGPLDVAVAWNFVAVLDQEKTEVVKTDEKYEEIRVTIVGLKDAAHPIMRDAFIETCGTKQAKAVFAKHGYAK